MITLDYSCETTASGHEIESLLFPDSEGFVTGTTTILTYEIDEKSGSAALDASQPSFSTEQSLAERFLEFFTLGAELSCSASITSCSSSLSSPAHADSGRWSLPPRHSRSPTR